MKTTARLRSFLAIAGSAVLTISYAHAATLYWDENGITTGFGTATGGAWSEDDTSASTPGTGRWTTSSTGILAGSAFQATSDTDIFNFGTSTLGLLAGTITVNSPVDMGNLTYGSASGAIVLSGSTINLAAAQTTTVNNTTNTISSILAGAATSFTKAGSGILVLSGANTYTGTTIISGGTLQVGDGTTGSLGATPSTFAGALTFNNSGGTFNVAEATGSDQKMGALTFTAGDGNVTSTAAGGPGNLATLTFASLAARTAGATGNFTLAANTTVGENKILLTSTTNAPLTSGSNDRGLFFGGTEYARYDATNGFKATAYGTDTNASALVSGATIGATTIATDIKLNGAITGQTTTTVNTINLGGANNFTFSNAANILSVNGILATAGATIANTTTVSTIRPGAAGGELVIRVDGSSNTLGVQPIIANHTSASALTKSGAGTLNLTHLNTYTGATTVNGGTLQIGGGGNLNAGNYAGAIAIRQGATFTWASSAAQTLSGNITGAGSVILNNASAILTLNNATTNNYSGGFILNSGQVSVPVAANYYGFGTGILTLNGGSMRTGNTTGNINIANDVLWNANVAFGRSSGGNPIFTFNGNITLGASVATSTISGAEPYSLTFNGNIGESSAGFGLNLNASSTGSVWRFDGHNTFTGTLNTNGKALVIGGSGYLGGGSYSANISGNGTMNYSSSANQTLSGIITVSSLTKDTNSSTLTLSGGASNVISGLTTVSAGTLELNKSGAFNAIVSGGLTINTGGTVQYHASAGTDQIGNASTVTVAGGTFDLNGKSDTVGSLVYQSGTVTTSAGLLTLANNSATALSMRNTAFTVDIALSNTTTTGVGVTFDATNNGTAAINGGINLNSAGTAGVTRTFTIGNGSAAIDMNIAGVIAHTTNAAGLLKAGAGTLALTNANTYGGATTINAGTLDLGGGTASGSLSSTVLNLGGGTLSYTRTGSTTQNFTTTNLNAGPLSAVSVVSGNILNLGTIVNAGGAIVFGSTGAGTVAADTASNVGGIISGATFNGTNWAVANGTTSAITGYSGSYTLTSAAGNTAANYTGFNMSVDSSQSPVAVITPNSLRFNNAGAFTLTLTGTTNTISSGGIMVDSTVGNNASVITGGTLRGGVSGGLSIIQNNTTGANSALTIGSIIANNTSTTLNKSGDGTLILTNNANSYTGATTINGGTLEIGGGGRLTSGNHAGAITIASGATFKFASSAATQTITGLISGAGGLTKSGTGILILGNSGNSYTGKTLVTGGVLQSGIAWNNQPNSIPGGMGNASTGSNIELNGGILSMDFNLDRSLGNGPGQIQLTGGRSGISTLTNPRGLWTVGGNASFEVVWGASGEGAATGFFNPSTFVMNDAAASPTYQSTLANPVDLNGANRTIEAASSSFFGQISGVIRNSNTSTAAGLFKTGVGELRLANANTFNGTTTISGGFLNLTNASALQNSALDTTASVLGNASQGLRTTATTLALGGLIGSKDFDDTGSNSVFTTTTTGYTAVTALTLNVGTGNSFSYSGVIGNGAATTSLTKNGLGSQTLSGSSTYTGATTLSAGTLALGNGGNLLGSATVGSAVSVTGTLAVSQNANATSNAIGQVGQSTASTLTFNAGSALNMSDTYTSTLNLVGTATLAPATGVSPRFTFDLNGASNGTTDLLAISGAATVGNAKVNIVPVFSSPGSLNSSNTYSVITAASGLGTANFTLGGQFNYAIGGSVWSTSLATSTGTSQIVSFVNTPYAANAYWQGGTDGSWISQNGTSFVTNFAQDAAGTYNLLATPVSTSSVFVGTTTASNLSAMTLDQAFSISGLTYTGTNTSNTAGSTLAAGTGGSLTIGTGGITVLSGSGANTISAPVTLGGVQSWTNNSANLLTVSGDVTNGANNLTVNGTGNTTISGNLGSGSGSLTKDGTGILELSGANAYSGTTTVNGGTLQLNSNSNGGLGSGTFTVGAATIQALNADRTISQGITLGATSPAASTFSGSYSITSMGQMSGGGAIRVLTNNITVDKTLTFAGYTSTGNFTINGTGTTIVDGGITRVTSGDLFINPGTGGTVMLNGTNTYGNMTINGTGRVIARAAGGASGFFQTSAGAQFNYVAAADVNMTGGFGSTDITGGTLANPTTFGFSVGASTTSARIYTVNNLRVLGGANNYIKVNVYGVTGVNRLNGTNNYELIRGAGGGTTQLDDGNYSLGTVFNNTDFTVGAITKSSTNLVISVIKATALDGNVYWKGGLAGNTGVWSASNGTTQSNWQVTDTVDQPLAPGATADLVFSTATSPGTMAAMTLGADVSVRTLTINNTATAFDLDDDGFKLTITPASSSAGITIASGVQASTIEANVGLGAAQTWTNNSVNALTVSGVVSGANSLTTAGTGTTILSGINSYTGATNVNDGKLLINGSTHASSTFTVASGATLGGTGTIGGATTIQSGGIYNPGASAGTLNQSAGLTIAAGGIFEWENNTINTLGSAGTNWDVANVSSGSTTISNTASTGSKIKLMFTNAATSFSDSFWNSNQSWNFITGGVTAGNLFDTSNITVFINAVQQGVSNIISGQGEFSTLVSGSNLQLVWTAAAGTPYDTWINGYPSIVAPNKDPDDDPDFDGVTNLAEFAFGTDPTSGSSGPNALVYGASVTTPGQPVQTFTITGPITVDFNAVFGRRTTYVADGLTYTVQFSANNVDWETSAATPVQVATPTLGIEAVKVPYPLFITTPSVQKPTFFRVTVSMP